MTGEIAENKYYEDLIIKINSLLETNQNQFALQLINEELDLPYIPPGYEEIFIELRKKASFIEEQPEIKKIDITVENFTELINTDDQIFRMAVMEELNHTNIRLFIPQIKNWFLENDDDTITNLIMFETLKNQDIDDIFIVKGHELNPLTEVSFFDRENVQAIMLNIQNKNEYSPQVRSIMEHLLISFISTNYFSYEEFLDILEVSLFNIAKMNLGEINNDDLNENDLKILSLM